MPVDLEALRQRLRSALPEDALLTGRAGRFAYRYDASVDRAWPGAVALPENREQLLLAARIALAEGLPLTCRGAGTGLSGGAVPAEGALVLGTARLRRILALEPAARIARVEPGLVNLALSKAAAAHDLRYAPDPSSQRTCTIGGNISENSGGPHCLKYGVTAQHLLGVEALLPDGEEVSLGGEAIDPPGLDLLALICGGEGTLGVVAAATVRLMPIPEASKTLLAVFDDLAEACRAVSEIIRAGIIPAALEMIDQLTIQAVEEVIRAGYPAEAEAVLLIEIDGPRAGLNDEAERIRAVCQGRAVEVREARDAAERARLWRGRKEAIGALGKVARDYYIQDGVIPRSALPEALPEVRRIGERRGLRIANVFHAGDGNLHPVILFDRKSEGALAQVIAAGTEILELCVRLGGTITGEHGIGLEKRHAVGLLFTEEDLALFARIRAAFDPEGLMNPGKIFPVGSGCLEGGARRRALPPEDPGSPARALPIDRARAAAPGFEAEAQQRLRQHSERGAPLVIAGGGSWSPRAGRRPRLDTRGHRGIVDYAPEDLVITARCGAALEELAEVTRERGQRLPLLRAFPGRAQSLGGALAVRPGGGHRRPGHGSARERVIGLRFLSAEGRVHQVGGRVPKNVAGYDLTRLLVGSRGCLGLILEASLLVQPIRPGRSRLLAGAAEEVERGLEALVACGFPFVALSALNPAALSAHSGREDGRWAIACGAEGEAALLEEFVRVVDRACPRLAVLEEASEERCEDGWARLDALPERLSGSHPCWTRVHARPDRAWASLTGLPPGTVGLARRLCGLVDVHAAAGVRPVGGSWRRALTPWEPRIEVSSLEPAALRIHRAIKRAFDPAGVLPDLLKERP